VVTRRVTWTIEDGRGRDMTDVRIDGDRFAATGRATNDDPEPYELGYDVRTGSRFVTEELVVEVTQGDDVRRLRLTRSSTGAWDADVDGESASLPDLGGALDCDLGRCPTTNSMPVLRERLLERDEPVEFVMALVEVPALVIRRSRQRYEPMATRPDGSRLIRFVSLDSDFRSELTFDPDGLVIDYPQLARRIHGA
jgi:uncharacterized protein